MKKTVIAILSVVLVLSLSMVALVACNNDKDAETASNTEVLGTAVAVAAQSAMGSASSSATDNAGNTEDDFQAGVNLTVGNGAIDLAAGASIKGIGAAMQPVLEKTISQVDQFLGENGIKVEKVASDREGYTDKLAISGTYVDEATGESTTYEYALYVGVQGGDGIDGKKDYTFNALIVIPTDSDPIEYEFSGTASYDTSKDAMIFNLGADAQAEYANAFAGVQAYATKKGTIVIELNAGAGVTESIVANASVSVELGKLDESRYGAVVTVEGTANVAGYGVSFNVTANVYANSTENATDFDINGKFEATIALPNVTVVGGTYKASADLSGKAKYVVEDDNLEVGLTGNVTFAKVEEENK
mgnify:CR=1 FL=1